jgi:hypothetical protein
MSGYHAQALRCNSEVATRLAKLISRLASTHDGEVLATVGAIRRTLESAGLDLHDLAWALTTDTPIADRPQDDWLAVARWCRDRRYGLNDRERQFVEQMASWCRWLEPSEKQGAWLRAIAERLASRESAA